jgi:hypothetical protein
MITAIFIDHKTTLTIETTEEANLEQMGREATPIPLKKGSSQIDVGPGVFRVLSNQSVRVTAPTQIYVETAGSKDPPPDPPPGITLQIDPVAVKAFFTAGKGISIPL